MPSIIRQCRHCNKYAKIETKGEGELVCPLCSKPWGTLHLDTIFSNCPICECRQFYVQKDFNRGLGCLIVLIGILLVPKTLGLSLPVFAGIDWLLYRRTKAMVICYRCGAEFRGFAVPESLKPYMHHIGLKYDQKRLGH